MKRAEMIDVNQDNVSELGFFCLMSRKRSEGYQRKLKWLQARFAEGMRIKLLKLPARGFIEYIPGQYAWRPVLADGYMFIHCLWVVGQSKGKGYGSLLLEECIRDARNAGLHGVAMATSNGNWLLGKKLLERHGFESVDRAPPSFELLVKKFRDAPSPSFAGDWEAKVGRCGRGFTVFRSDQCPYLEDAVRILADTAQGLGIPIKVVELKNCRQIREFAPSAYGVFDVVLDGKPFSYHYLLKKQILRRLKGARFL